MAEPCVVMEKLASPEVELPCHESSLPIVVNSSAVRPVAVQQKMVAAMEEEARLVQQKVVAVVALARPVAQKVVAVVALARPVAQKLVALVVLVVAQNLVALVSLAVAPLPDETPPLAIP